MNVAYSDRGPVDYDEPAPLILAASSPDAGRRARRVLDQWGARIAAEIPIDQALERLDQQAAASAVWVEVDEDAGGALDDLLHRIARDVGNGRYAAVVSTSRDILDQVVSGLGDSTIDVLVDADELERAAALAIATSETARGHRLSDVAADRSAEQLRQLTAEVNRIAGMLSRLSDGPAVAPRPVEKAVAGDQPEVSVDTVRKIIRARRLRARFFPDHLFADPAWDMLLDCSRPSFPICGCRSPACASPPRCPRPRRCAGSRRWSARGCSCAAPTPTTAAACSSNSLPTPAPRCAVTSRRSTSPRRLEHPCRNRRPVAGAAGEGG